MDLQFTTFAQLLTSMPDACEQIASWHHQEWAHLNPGQTLAMRCDKMRAPQAASNMLVAVYSGQVVGTAAIEPCDMATRPKLTPWLASVYVAHAYRGRGIGRQLVQRTMQKARALGFEKLYLFTPHHAKFYKALGWLALEQTRYHDELVTVMHCELAAKS